MDKLFDIDLYVWTNLIREKSTEFDQYGQYGKFIFLRAKSLITVNMDIIDKYVDKYAQYIKT